MIIIGLPATVNTSAGPVNPPFDIVSNGRLDNDSIFVRTYTPGEMDISSAYNKVLGGEIGMIECLLPAERDYIIDITGRGDEVSREAWNCSEIDVGRRVDYNRSADA